MNSLSKQLSEKINEKLAPKFDVVRTIQESRDYLEKLRVEAENKVEISILIATTVDRRAMFNLLMQEFHRQVEIGSFKGLGIEKWGVSVPRIIDDVHQPDENGEPAYDVVEARFKHPDRVEIVHAEDDKEISIGAKRQQLLERAKGKYIVFFDSDDMPRKDYLSKIMTAIANDQPDCIGFRIYMTTNGQNPETCIHSLSNPEWKHDGKNYLRNVTHFNPVLRDLAIQVGFQDIRFGEDKIYSDAVSKLCKKETFIDDYLFDYRYSDHEEHGKKYGISK